MNSTRQKKSSHLKGNLVHSMREIEAQVVKAHKLLNVQHDEELWFRGVSSSSHRLVPSLLRALPPSSLTHKQITQVESDLFFENLSKARTEQSGDLTHWDVLFLMQHYRAPTRLLDWTEVLYVALHFAVAYLPQNYASVPRIFLFNPYQWNKKQTGFGRDLVWPRYFGYDQKEDYFYEYGEILVEGGADWKNPVALYPPQRDDRLSAQRGYFTIHGHDSRPMDEIDPSMFHAIDLSPSAVEEVRISLSLAGINEYSLFPDLEGLSRHLRKKYGLS